MDIILNFLSGKNIGLYLLLLIFLILLFIKFMPIFLTTLDIKKYHSIQKIHPEDFVSREGGVAIYLTILVFWLTGNYSSINYFDTILFYSLVFCLPFLMLAVLEDIFQNIHPSLRLASLFLSSFLFLKFQIFGLPLLDIPFLSIINQSTILSTIFYSFCIVLLCNGMNIIDGSNGLACTTGFSSLVAISFLSYINGDYLILYLTISFSLFLLVFLLFNYPFGKIFLGDFGAYFIGWILSILLIIFFSRNPEIPTWNAAVIVFYPIFEIIFSFWRKVISGLNPMHPDGKHLHIKLFFLLKKALKRDKVANCLILPFMAFFWLLPALSIPWIYTNIILIFIILVMLIFSYLGIYYYLPNAKK